MAVSGIHEARSPNGRRPGGRTPDHASWETRSMRQYQIQDYESDGATCPVCGDSFSGRAGLSKHHAAQHGGKFLPLAACDWCGELYTETVANINASDRHYCSDSCRSASHSHQRSGEQNPLYKEDVIKSCEECNEQFSVNPSETDSRFCSSGCYFAWRRDQYLGGSEHAPVEKELVVCEWCGDSFRVYPSRLPQCRFCSDECSNEWKASRTGQDHPLWEGGTDWYRAIRSSLGPTGWGTQRDRHLGDRCELCGDSDATLALHHIVPVLAGGTNAAYNYMTLCRGCHSNAEDYTRQYSGFGRILSA